MFLFSLSLCLLNHDNLQLREQSVKGECLNECKTIEKACLDVMGFGDADLAELIYTHPDMKLPELESSLCKEQTSACKGKRPTIPKVGKAWK